MDIGVIGGADGPTAIYVASSVNWALVIGAVVIIAGCAAAFFVRRRKSRDSD